MTPSEFSLRLTRIHKDSEPFMRTRQLLELETKILRDALLEIQYRDRIEIARLGISRPLEEALEYSDQIREKLER